MSWLHKCHRVIWWVAYKSSDRRRPVHRVLQMKVCTSLGSCRSAKCMGRKSSYQFSNTLNNSSIYRAKLSNSSKLHLPLGSMALVRWALSTRASTSPTTTSTVCCNQRSCSAKQSSHHLIVKQRQTELTPICHIQTQNTNLRTNISCLTSKRSLVLIMVLIAVTMVMVNQTHMHPQFLKYI